MKFGWSLALVALLAAGSAIAQDTASEKGKLSYAIGYQIGSGLVDRKIDVDINTVVRAVEDAYAKRNPTVPQAAMADALSKLDQKMKAEGEKVLADNKRTSDQFLAQNRSKTGIVALPSGAQYRVIEAGSGKQVLPTSELTFHARISLPDGRELKSSFISGQPLKAKVSDLATMSGSNVLPQVVEKMKAGDHWQVFLPPEPASGNQVFIWEIKLISVL